MNEMDRRVIQIIPEILNGHSKKAQDCLTPEQPVLCFSAHFSFILEKTRLTQIIAIGLSRLECGSSSSP